MLGVRPRLRVLPVSRCASAPSCTTRFRARLEPTFSRCRRAWAEIGRWMLLPVEGVLSPYPLQQEPVRDCPQILVGPALCGHSWQPVSGALIVAVWPSRSFGGRFRGCFHRSRRHRRLLDAHVLQAGGFLEWRRVRRCTRLFCHRARLGPSEFEFVHMAWRRLGPTCDQPILSAL